MTKDQESLVVHLAQLTELGLDAQPKKPKQTPHRVKFRGQFIRTHSNKTVWPSKGAAKNALNRELGICMWKLIRFEFLTGVDYMGACYQPRIVATKEALTPITYKEVKEIKERFEEEVLIEIEIVPVTPDEFYQKRK